MSRLPLTMWVIPAIITLASCSRTDVRPIAVFPVDGQILIGGRPAEGAVVAFEPVSDREGIRRVEAVTRADGHVMPTQPDGAVGLPEGEYVLKLRRAVIAGGTPGEAAAQEEAIGSLRVVPGINIAPPIRLAK